MNQITLNQLNELINLRLKSIGLENYSEDISVVKDPIIKWYLTIRKRINK